MGSNSLSPILKAVATVDQNNTVMSAYVKAFLLSWTGGFIQETFFRIVKRLEFFILKFVAS